MRESNLPNPGTYGHGQRLRREVANAISAAEITSKRTQSGVSGLSQALKTFLIAAAEATPGTGGIEPTPTQALLNSGDTLPLGDVDATVTIAAGVPSLSIPGTNAVVADAQVIDIAGTTYTLTVVAGVITEILVA